MVALIRHLLHIIGEASLKQANALKLILSGASVLVIETKTASSITGLVLDDFFKTSFSKREDLSPKENKDLQQKLLLAARQLELAVKQAILKNSINWDNIPDPSTLTCKLVTTYATSTSDLTIDF